MDNWTVADVINNLPKPTIAAVGPLPAPAYVKSDRPQLARVALAVESMKRHMTDEGWQLMLSLEHNGFMLAGHGLMPNLTSVPDIVRIYNPGVVVVQDKREWDGKTAGGEHRGFNPAERFTGIGCLRERSDIFKLTVVKDAQHDASYHREAAHEIGCHAWIVYYHRDIVCHLAPYIRPQHVIRTYHTLNANIVPKASVAGSCIRGGTVLSGALSSAYPLRTRLNQELKGITIIPHPGYHRRGCATPEYLRTLTGFKVAICTASKYGYALRKIIEATACGCAVVTDLPVDELLPAIDGNLHRVHPQASTEEIQSLIRSLEHSYDIDLQRMYAKQAVLAYDYCVIGRELTMQIDHMRNSYRA